MPDEGQRSAAGVELVELRVLDGPNRFFTRPAVKLEFLAVDAAAAADTLAAARSAVAELHAALDLRPPAMTTRTSRDGCRVSLAVRWRRRTIGQAIVAAAARVALGQSDIRHEVRALAAVSPGPLASVLQPRIPVVAVTGTNGKSTTTRLIAHVAAAAGRRVGMTNSDGIHVRGELVEAGDWTGFGGAGRVLSEPGLDLAVLETARGGILLRGVGYAANDVSVVTNVSADHLGLQGIDTLDELAEVKATVVRITRRTGWAVLNCEDPRVWAMRHETRAGWYAFALDPAAPGVREALGREGRAAVAEDGWLVLRRGGRRRRLLPLAEAPVTLGGLARYNVANVLAAAAACDALGLRSGRIVEGLRSFSGDLAVNPGRLNLFERNGRLVLVDFAHNEAGLAGLLEVARGLARGRVRVAIGTAGDRTDEVLRNLGRLAAEGADDLVICEKPHYLRGRTLDEMNALFRAGAAAGGYRREVPALPGEVAALGALVERARRGDVVAVMSHAERPQIFAWLQAHRFRAVSATRLAEIRGSAG